MEEQEPSVDVAMSSSWREDEEDFRQGAGKGVALRSKPRFSFHEVKVLLEAVKRNRYVLLKKFNHGVSVEAKKRAWIEITNQINDLGENHREVRQIMKKWADLTCDGRRRLMSLRKPHTGYIRKKTMGPVERVVHKLLLLSPSGNGDSDFEMFEEEDFSKGYSGTPPPNPSPHSYLSLTDSSHSVPDRFSYDMSPLSSPEEDAGGDPFQSSSEFDLDLAEEGEQSLDFEDNYESLFSYPSSLPPSSSLDQDQVADSQLRVKPVHTYSRNSSQNNNNNHVQNHTSSKPPPGVSDSDAGSSSAAPPLPSTSSNMAASSSSPFIPPLPPSSSSVTPNGSTSQPTASSSSVLQPPPSSAASSTNSGPSSSNSHRPSPASSSSSSSAPPSNQSPVPSSSCDPLPAGASSRRAQDHVAQMASQSLQQQRASRMLLASVSQSLEVLAQSVQLLVESQQEFVQESLQLQRETVDILRDFSSTALTMLRDKANSGQVPRHLHHPTSHY